MSVRTLKIHALNVKMSRCEMRSGAGSEPLAPAPAPAPAPAGAWRRSKCRSAAMMAETTSVKLCSSSWSEWLSGAWRADAAPAHAHAAAASPARSFWPAPWLGLGLGG